MNQRLTNRSRHAAVLGRQLVKRRDGVGVAKNNGHLSAFLAQCGLTLGTGLGRGHSGSQLANEVHALAMRLPSGEVSRHEPTPLLAGGRDGEQALFGGDSNQLARLGADGFGKGAALGKGSKHVRSPSGPIPPMGESYAVTSDVSTPCTKDFLEAA